MNPFASQFFHAWYQKQSHSVCVLWWEHGVLSVTHGKSGGVFFRPSFKLDVSPSLCTQQTAEVTQMRFFLLRSATCPIKPGVFNLHSRSQTQIHGKVDVCQQANTSEHDNHTSQSHRMAYYHFNIFPQRCFESKQIKVIRLQMSSKTGYTWSKLNEAGIK